VNALVLCFERLLLPPPWFVPVEAPACGAVLDVRAEQTNDGVARRFVCDRPEGHGEVTAKKGKHRQVTDNESGATMEWPTDGNVDLGVPEDPGAWWS
jgi:hypothetical protein